MGSPSSRPVPTSPYLALIAFRMQPSPTSSVGTNPIPVSAAGSAANGQSSSITRSAAEIPVAVQTNSSTPTIHESESKGSALWAWVRRIIMLGLVIAAAATYKTWKPWAEKLLPAPPAAAGRPPARPATVAFAVAEQKNIDLTINALGTVTAFNTVTVKSRVDGELKRIAFTEGQTVQQGELLAELDARPFEALRDQAKGQLERDQAALELAEVTLHRSDVLRQRDATSQQEYDEALALKKQAQAVVNVDQANLANAQLQVDYTKILAPISGRIGLRIVDLGNIVKANDANGLLVITQLQPISIVFAIPQDEIHRVQMQLQKQPDLPVEVFNRDFSVKLAVGKLTAVDNQVDAATGTLRLKAVFPNEDNALFPNEFVNVRLKVETLTDVTTVPSMAVQRGPKDRFVYLIKDDDTIEIRSIVTGPTEGLMTVIESGLKPGDKVVTEGVDRLQPGAKVALPKAP